MSCARWQFHWANTSVDLCIRRFGPQSNKNENLTRIHIEEVSPHGELGVFRWFLTDWAHRTFTSVDAMFFPIAEVHAQNMNIELGKPGKFTLSAAAFVSPDYPHTITRQMTAACDVTSANSGSVVLQNVLHRCKFSSPAGGKVARTKPLFCLFELRPVHITLTNDDDIRIFDPTEQTCTERIDFLHRSHVDDILLLCPANAKEFREKAFSLATNEKLTISFTKCHNIEGGQFRITFRGEYSLATARILFAVDYVSLTNECSELVIFH